jgi:hypothetical protein
LTKYCPKMTVNAIFSRHGATTKSVERDMLDTNTDELAKTNDANSMEPANLLHRIRKKKMIIRSTRTLVMDWRIDRLTGSDS